MLIENNLTRGDLSGNAKVDVKLSSELKLALESLSARVGQKLSASIESIHQLSDQQRFTLLEQKLQGSSSKPMSDLWTKLLSSPAVKHVELSIQQKTIQVLSDLPLSKSQAISVLVTPTGLKLMPMQLEPTLNPKLNDSPIQPQRTDTQLTAAKTLSLSAPSVHQATATNQNSSKTDLLTDKNLNQALARVLPLAKTPESLLNAMIRITENIQSIPLKTAPPQARALVTLIRTLSSTPAFNIDSSIKMTASELRAVINHSGVFHENTQLIKDGELIRSPRAGAQQPGALEGRQSSNQATPKALDVDPQRPNDLKSQLIQLLQLLPSLQALPLANHKKSEQDGLSKLFAAILKALSPSALGHTNQTNASSSRQLQLLVEQSLARIQLQQYKTLVEAKQEPSALRPNNLHLDLAVKTPDGYMTVPLQIMEIKERIKTKQEKDRKRNTGKQVKSSWRVYFEMDLGPDGSLAVELKVKPEALDATLWADKQPLRERANEHVKDLSNELRALGMQVNDIRCSPLAPPGQKLHLEHSLVDIRT